MTRRRKVSRAAYCTSVFPQQDVRDQRHQHGGQQADNVLVHCDGALQSVYALLHGASVEVVIDGGSNAPHHPYGIHQRLHGRGNHPERERERARDREQI